MLGAIIGDLAGSIYEYEQFQKVTPIKVKNIIENDAFFSDDTILTIAILDAVLNQKDYAETLKAYTKRFSEKVPANIPYFKTMFSPSFTNWAYGKQDGLSNGNGAMMRISPIGYLFNTEKEVKEQATLATTPSHNTTEAITSAKTVAMIIFYARRGFSKQQIIDKLQLKIKKPIVKEFNYTCAQTLDICLYCLFRANSFEESLKLALSFGGDTDTNACIVGSMAEALYGISDKLKQIALSKLPTEFVNLLNKGYAQIKK